MSRTILNGALASRKPSEDLHVSDRRLLFLDTSVSKFLTVQPGEEELVAFTTLYTFLYYSDS
jgi:hypothetical protein